MISVVLPTYNRAGYLPGAIKSVLRQTLADWELIIVDDGSTDKTRAVLARFADDPRIHVMLREHEGQNLTMRAGVEAARGQVIAFLSSDDELTPQALQDYAQAMQDDGCDVAYGDVEIEWVDAIFHGTRGQVTVRRVEEPDVLPLHNVVWGCAFRRAMYDALGGWPIRWEIAGDYGFWLSAYASGYKFRRVPAVTYHYRYHVGGQTYTRRRQQLAEADDVQAQYRAGLLGVEG